jgi:hypothetical protein
MGLSLVVAAAGIYLITRVHTLNAQCASNATGGVSPDCMNSVSLYFIGFILVLASMIVMMLAFMSLRRRDHRHASAQRARVRIAEQGPGPRPYSP